MAHPKFAMLAAFAASLMVPFVAFAQKKPRIIVVTHGQAADPFWTVVRNGAETAARETDCDLEYESPGVFDLQAMARLIDVAAASKPDALVVSIPDAVILAKSTQV
jgi:simple sugar transport system substrate-binding protein